MTEPGFSIVCVSRQDWHAGLPTNRQQIMIRAARRGHRVLFVESGGHIGRHLWRLVTGPEPRLGRTQALRRRAAGRVDHRREGAHSRPLGSEVPARQPDQLPLHRSPDPPGGPRPRRAEDPLALRPHGVRARRAGGRRPHRLRRRRRLRRAGRPGRAPPTLRGSRRRGGRVPLPGRLRDHHRPLRAPASAEPGHAPRSQRRRLRPLLARERDGARGALLRRARRRLRREPDRGEGRLRPARGRRPRSSRVELRPRRASGRKTRAAARPARSSRQRARCSASGPTTSFQPTSPDSRSA